MAIHRSVFLGNEAMDHGGRTLLVTFNRALVAYLEHLRPPELSNVEVRTFHHFARGYLASRGRMGYGWIASENERQALVATAVAEVRAARQEAVLSRPVDYFLNEFRFIAQHGLDDEAAYVAADRVGRPPLERQVQRPALFAVYERYLELREGAGSRYDWDDVALAARRELERDRDARLYQHVVIDEGQDFSPEMLRSLALAVPDDGSLTFFGDVAQQIYGRGVSWRSAGLQVRAEKQFTRNNRNSPQIAELGLAIADMPYFRDQPDMVRPTGFAAAGPPPTLVRLEDETAETDFVIEQAREAARAGSVGVLMSRRSDERRFADAFRGGQRLHRDLLVWSDEPGISYGTVHAAKGLEFDTVILVGLTDDRWPEPEAVAADGIDDATAVGGRLLYVAVTRARQNLIMTVPGTPTPLLPDREGLWVEVQP